MNPTEEQVELGARAIDAHWSEGDGRKFPYEDTEREYQAHCHSTARACLAAALGDGVVVPHEPTAEDIYACAKSTLIGFRDELTERNIEFICDQISRKAAMSVVPAWRDIATAPKDGTPILTFRPDTHGAGFSPITGIDVLCWEHDCWFYAGDSIVVDFPTHWQPLPDAPDCGPSRQTEGK